MEKSRKEQGRSPHELVTLSGHVNHNPTGIFHRDIGSVRGLVVGLAGGERRKVDGGTLRCTVDPAATNQW